MSTVLKPVNEYHHEYESYVQAEKLRQQQIINEQFRHDQSLKTHNIPKLSLKNQVELYKMNIIRQLEINHGQLPLSVSAPIGMEDYIQSWLAESGMKLHSVTNDVGGTGMTRTSYQIVDPNKPQTHYKDKY